MNSIFQRNPSPFLSYLLLSLGLQTLILLPSPLLRAWLRKGGSDDTNIKILKLKPAVSEVTNTRQ